MVSMLEENVKIMIYSRLWQLTGHADSDLASLEQRLGYLFVQKSLLFRALTHSSAVRDHKHLVQKMVKEGETSSGNKWSLVSNERLEFLGDSVLGLATSSLLFERQERFVEGELSRIRAALVNTEALAQMARCLDLGPCLLLGKGEMNANGHEKTSLLADAMEATIGAVYCDAGFERSLRLVQTLMRNRLQGSLQELLCIDYKTELQEISQRQFQLSPRYEIIAESGPDHCKSFIVAVFLDNHRLAESRGSSKKSAAQEAAKLALERFTCDGKFIDGVKPC